MTTRLSHLTGLATLALGLTGRAPAQDPKPAPPGGESRAAILADYARERSELERRKLRRIARLAEGQPPAEAIRTYEDYLRSAVETGLFAEAEPVAERLAADADNPPELRTLAVVVNFVAEADRGAYDESLKSLAAAVEAAKADAGAGRPIALPPPARLSVLEAYYQRLVQHDQFEPARAAMRLVADAARDPAIREYAAARLKELNLVGRPAPPVKGTDVDGRPFDLADLKGKVVLVVFWATWLLPSADEAEALRAVDQAYRDRGLRIVGINLDTSSDPDRDAAAVLPEVRHFLIEHNVPWPNLINGPGEADHAAAFGITDIPANVLIDREGKVAHLDLTPSNLQPVVERTLGP